MGQRRGRMMQIRVDVTVQRSDMPRAQPGAEFIKRAATAVAQHEIEVAQTRRSDIGDAFAGFQTRQCYGCIQIVEDPKRPALGEYYLSRSKAVGAIGGDDRDIRVGQVDGSSWPRALPILVEFQPASGQFVEIAHIRIVGDITFIEYDVMSAPDQRLA